MINKLLNQKNKLKSLALFVYLIHLIHVRYVKRKFYENEITNFTINDSHQLNSNECLDWIHLEPRTYFKRQASYFFWDASLITLNYIAKNRLISSQFAIQVYVQMNNQIYRTEVSQSRSILLMNDIFDGAFGSYSLLFRFDLKWLDKKIDPLKHNFSIYITFNKAPKNRINLQAKQLNAVSQKENNSIICSKCIFKYPNSKDDLNWWFHVNARVGQKFIDICDPLGNASLLSKIIPSNLANFVLIRRLSCFPNLKSESHVNVPFFNSYQEYIRANDVENKLTSLELFRRIDLINEVMINECYMDYIDKYRYVTILDSDELILDTKIQTQVRFQEQSNYFETNTSLNSYYLGIQQRTKLFDYLSSIQRLDKLSSEWMFFKAGWYLDRFIMNSLCRNFTSMFRESEKFFKELTLKIWSLNRNFVLTFKIRTTKEARYLKFLCQLNEKLPSSLESSDNQPKLKLENFFRLFYVLKNDGGKTVHDTNRVFSVSTHFPKMTYTIRNYYSQEARFHLPKHLKDIFVDYTASHMLHFRRNMRKFNHIIFISEIGLDFNYYDYLINP